jgi:hypothetical protein
MCNTYIPLLLFFAAILLAVKLFLGADGSALYPIGIIIHGSFGVFDGAISFAAHVTI